MQSHICFVQPYVFTYVVIITESGTPAVVRWDKSIVKLLPIGIFIKFIFF